MARKSASRDRILRWGEQSSLEIKTLDRQLPVIIPIGSVESHGDHLPVGCDTIAAARLARDACARTGAVLAPSVAYGVIPAGEHDGDVPISINAFTAYVCSVVEGFYKNGFRKIILVNGHGGNIDALESVCAEALEKHDDIKITNYEWWRYQIPKEWDAVINEGSHADRGETGFMLAVRPDLVEMNHARDSNGPKIMTWYYQQGSGVDGHPTQATISEGKKIYRIVLNKLVKLAMIAKVDKTRFI
ncbi:MAG: creatininase family protein [DPANN group archaeon]|nr:creatininase family protein [DPANN group archaeon]